MIGRIDNERGVQLPGSPLRQHSEANPRFGFAAAPLFPITSQYLPTPNNINALLEIAFINRIATGGLRAVENMPGRMADPMRSDLDKVKAAWERVFVEIFGITVFILSMYMGMDATGRLLNRFVSHPKLQFDASANQAKLESHLKDLNGLSREGLLQKAQAVADKTFCGKKGAPEIVRALTKDKASLITFQKNLLDALSNDKTVQGTSDQLTKVAQEVAKTPSLSKFVSHYNKMVTTAMLSGILLISPFMGGGLIQWLNDRMFSPWMDRVLRKRGLNAIPAAYQDHPALNPATAHSRLIRRPFSNLAPTPIQMPSATSLQVPSNPFQLQVDYHPLTSFAARRPS
ncbi:MAG: hypothetical protein KTR14_08330 [Vampirovibrio sp.]|nr:hypothetical protein [Vampirovibrio sp.]